MNGEEMDVSKFLTYLDKELNYSEKTIISYKQDLASYFDFLTKNKINYLKITRDEVRSYLKYLDSLGLKNSSIARHLSTLRSFYNYLVNENIIENNIFGSIRNPKIEKKLPNFLSYNELSDLLESISLDTPADFRNRLIIELFYATGCRVSELCKIKISDIDKSAKTIKIQGKGKKERIVFFGEYALIYLDKYLHGPRDELLKGENSEYLFISDKGKALQVMDVEVIMQKLMQKMATKKHVTPHTLRHTFATHLLNAGADIKSVQELLGHASLNTTGIYTHVTNDRIKEIYLKTFPRK